MGKLSPEAQAWKRIFAMLYLLRDDFSMRVHESKLALQLYTGQELQNAKRFHKLNVANHQAVCAMIHNIHLQARSKASTLISEEMTSERIKDLHVGLDTLLDIENIAEVCETLKKAMIPADSGS